MMRAGTTIAFLALLCALHACNGAPRPAPVAYQYLRLPGMDVVCAESDLRHAGTTDERRVRSACDADADCQGYNSHGMLKQKMHAACLSADFDVEKTVLFRKTKHQAHHGLGFDPQISVVPLPSSVTMGKSSSVVSTSFSIHSTATNPDVTKFIENAVDRYWDLIKTHSASPAPSTGGLTGIVISVAGNSLDLGLSTDESYSLTVPETGMINLNAETVFGLLHGMETLSQLVEYDVTTGLYHIPNTMLTIKDSPRFPHRGILLDTARHYHSVPMLKRFLDSMSHAKFNVFHWHIVDSQAFPLQLRTLPDLVRGAYTPQEIYTPGDVQDVVAYAKSRGIRVIPEFDTPGHASSWCVGYPDVCPSASCNSPLNPATNKTFDLITTLITESKTLWSDDYIHLGGDEVNVKCWQNVPAVADWLKARNFSTDDAYKYFVSRTHSAARTLGRKSIHWEEVFNHFGGELDKDTIFQVWLSHATAAKIVGDGYQCILSDSDKWYLDHLSVSWETMYANDPYMGITDPKQQALMLGGEACMWGETVDDSDLFNTVWPRAAAVAERLWSPASANETESFQPRLAQFRCLLNRRGIAAAPINNKEARSAPPGPGSCEHQ